MHFIQNKNGMVVFAIGYTCGAINETVENAGISHMLEHMMFKSNSSSKSMKIWKDATSIGASMNARTSSDYTIYFVAVSSEYWEMALSIIKTITSALDLSEKEFHIEKKVVIEEWGLDSNTAFDRMMTAMYLGTPYASSVIGTHKTLTSISYADIISHHQKFYTSPFVCISCSLAIKPHIQRSIGEFAIKKQSSMPMFDLNNRCVKDPKARVVAKALKNENEKINLCFLGFPRYDIRSDVATLIAFILRHTLFELLREKHGMVYGVKVRHIASLFVGHIYIECETRFSNSAEISMLIFNEIANLEKLTQGDLRKYEKKMARSRKLWIKTNTVEHTIWNLKNDMFGRNKEQTHKKNINLEVFRDTIKTMFDQCRLGYFIKAHNVTKHRILYKNIGI